MHRLRRLRKNEAVRRLVRETVLRVEDLIWPIFVVEGEGVREAVSALPGVERISVDQLARVGREAWDLGIGALLLFGVPAEKHPEGAGAWAEDGLIPRSVSLLKKIQPELVIMTDVCLCSYTSHGHCGVVEGDVIDNDRSVDCLVRTALVHARSGADVVAPSDMMDGRVGAIRQSLDRAGYADTLVLSYAVKYASSFYGPFRAAAECAPAFGDRRTYQMDWANRREALREVAADLEEGADLVMIKPALSYLDIIRDVRERFSLPLVAYSVSGEYAMVKAAARQGWIDERAVVLEMLTSMKRAGADAIVTYFAPQVVRWLQEP